MQKNGQKYRQLYGVEFYFVPSLKTWKEQYDTHREAVQAERDAKKQEKVVHSKMTLIMFNFSMFWGSLLILNCLHTIV